MSGFPVARPRRGVGVRGAPGVVVAARSAASRRRVFGCVDGCSLRVVAGALVGPPDRLAGRYLPTSSGGVFRCTRSVAFAVGRRPRFHLLAGPSYCAFGWSPARPVRCVPGLTTCSSRALVPTPRRRLVPAVPVVLPGLVVCSRGRVCAVFGGRLSCVAVRLWRPSSRGAGGRVPGVSSGARR